MSAPDQSDRLSLPQGDGHGAARLDQAGVPHSPEVDLTVRNLQAAVELGTLDDLDDAMVYEFVRRICGGL